MNNNFIKEFVDYLKTVKKISLFIFANLPIFLTIIVFAIVYSGTRAIIPFDFSLGNEIEDIIELAKEWDEIAGYDPYDKTIVAKKLVSKKAKSGTEILEKIDIAPPFETFIITQLADVAGVASGYTEPHGALDIIPKHQQPFIKAGISGVVVENGYDEYSGYFITLEDEKTKVHVNYCHLKVKSPKKIGSTVIQNEVIGIMGSTGISTGDHVHMQVSIPLDNEYYWVNFIDEFKNFDYVIIAL